MIRLEEVSYNYPDGTPALENINLTVKKGEFLGIIGKNGSGKSTLALQLNGLLKPKTGRVKIREWTPVTLQNFQESGNSLVLYSRIRKLNLWAGQLRRTWLSVQRTSVFLLWRSGGVWIWLLPKQGLRSTDIVLQKR